MIAQNKLALLSEFNSALKENDDIYRGLSKFYGLSECAFWILYTLRVSETPVTQSDICGVMFQPKQTVNSALKKMENEGYIKLNSAANRRFKEIILTKKGITLAQNTVDHVIHAEIEALSTMSSEEFTSFLQLIGKFTQTLKHQMDNVKHPANGNSDNNASGITLA